MALLIVVSVLTVLGIMGVAFAFSMFLETQATLHFVATAQARYLAEGGITHSRALLDEDRLGSRVEELGEAWGVVSKGSDVDVDGDGTLEARWWPVKESGGTVVGRYALHVADESGKVNLHVARAAAGMGVEGVSLSALLEEIGISNALQKAEAVERYRHGPDGGPGVAGVDDDGDGAIDEADEYRVMTLLGDDRRLDDIDQVAAIAGLAPDEMRRLSSFVTVHSQDLNVSVAGLSRVNINAATATELLTALLEAGVSDPWQAAVNMADAAGADVEMSVVVKSAQLVAIANQGPLGGWTWSDNPRGHYESAEPDGASLSWDLPVPTGTFRLLARGLPGMRIGNVVVAGQLHAHVDDGESLGRMELSGTLKVEVLNREATGVTCAFRGIELVSEAATSGVMVRGVEAIRFNELMVEPVLPLKVSTATFDAQGSSWVCPGGTGICSNGGEGQARWVWTSTLLKPGRYYVRVWATAPDQTVGEVRVEGNSQLLMHGQRHPSLAVVASDGKISLTIGKTASSGTYYLQEVTLSLQPDAEYVELINLSDQPMDVSGWTIEGPLAGGRVGALPAGSSIAAHGLLLAAVDLDDGQAGLAGNGVSARAAWELSSGVPAVQLTFPTGSPTPDDDWLKPSVSEGQPRLMLRNPLVTVDEVAYAPPSPTIFQSIEKGDPTAISDEDQDGVDDGWFLSLGPYTPGKANTNEGLREIVGSRIVIHDPAQDVVVLNRPLAGVGELAGLPSGEAWKPFSSSDLAKIVDRFTVEGIRLEAEGHGVGPSGQAWEEKADGYLHTDAAKASLSGRWRWEPVPDGTYRLSLVGCTGCAGEQFSVRWQRHDEAFSAWSPVLSSDSQGRLLIGQITIGPPAGADDDAGAGEWTPAHTLVLEAQCASTSGICHLDHVRLDPTLIRVGPINVNTASREVLFSLPGMTDALASRILAGRPYGDQEHKGRGIGDLLLGGILGSDEEETLETFRRLGHWLTTRSDVFQILSLGQAIKGERVEATQRIQTIVHR